MYMLQPNFEISHFVKCLIISVISLNDFEGQSLNQTHNVTSRSFHELTDFTVIETYIFIMCYMYKQFHWLRSTKNIYFSHTVNIVRKYLIWIDHREKICIIIFLKYKPNCAISYKYSHTIKLNFLYSWSNKFLTALPMLILFLKKYYFFTAFQQRLCGHTGRTNKLKICNSSSDDMVCFLTFEYYSFHFLCFIVIVFLFIVMRSGFSQTICILSYV